MAKIIAVANQKGGVGKTTTCVNVCAALARRGRRVLLVDCDPQGNATSGMGVPKDSLPNIYDMLVRGTDGLDCIVKTPYGDVLPSNRELSGATVELVEAEKRQFVLRDALLPLKADYDYIFIDSPPSLEMLTVNALTAADGVLIPVQCEYYALEGIADLMTTVRLTKKSLNPRLEVQGIVMTMFDGRTNFSEQVAAEVEKFFGTAVYKTRIPRNVRAAEAPSHGKPVIDYDRLSKASRAYLHLADEFIKREE
ncbi:MAG: ParA family protein [Oscillospiraceae bacterium]